MSWFDTSNLTSFAKTALTQAQKSIDKVLDIDDEGKDSKQEFGGAKGYPVEKKKSDVSLPQQTPSTSTSALTTSSLKSKSAKRTPSRTESPQDDSTSKEDSFWSSFLGGETTKPSSVTKSKGRETSAGVQGDTTRVTPTPVKGKDQNTHHSCIKDDKESKDFGSNNKQLKIEGNKRHDKSVDPNRKKKHAREKLQHHSSAPDKLVATQSKHQRENEKNTDISSTVLGDANPSSLKEVKEHERERCQFGIDLSGEHYKTKNHAVRNELDPVFAESAVGGTTTQDISDGSAISIELAEAVSVKEKPLLSELNSTEALKESNKQIEIKPEIAKHKDTDAGDEKIHDLIPSEASQSKSDKLEQRTRKAKSKGIKSTANQELLKNSEKGQPTGRKHSQEAVDGSIVSVELSQAVSGQEFSETAALKSEKRINRELEPVQEQRQQLDVLPLASSTPLQNKKRRIKHDNKNATVPENEPTLPKTVEGNTVSVDLPQDLSSMQQRSFESVDAGDLRQPKTKSKVEKSDSQKVTSGVSLSEELGTSSRSREEIVSDEAKMQTRQDETLLKELESLKTVLEVRESKLICMSKENMDLQEANSILRNQIEQLEEIQKTEDAEMEQMREEFTLRIAATENNFHIAAKERDQLKAKLEETETFLTQTNEEQTKQYLSLLKEKDEQISELLSEGEKLSKQQLQSNNIIKKLRVKEKENDVLIKKQSKRLEETEAELKRLTEVLKVKDENEHKHEDGIIKLNAYVKKQEEQIARQSSDLEDAQEKIRSMQTTLDNAYKEIAELHRQNAAKDGVVQEAALSAEMMAKEERRIALEKTRRKFEQQEETLALQISDLQSRMSRTEQQSARREDNLRQEISDLQQRLQEAEARNQELAESVTLATRPLLRQIENLQNTHGNQAATWERIERSLTERINDSQTSLATAQEKERVVTEYAQELNTRLTSLEAQLSTYRQEKARLAAELEMNRAKLEAAEEAKTKESAKLETLQIKYRKMLDDANVEKTLVEQQLAVEKSKVDAEKKKIQAAVEEKERQIFMMRQSSISSVPSSPTLASDTSPGSMQNYSADGSFHKTHARTGSASCTNSSMVDGMSRGVMPAGTAFVERLQAQLRQKDGEIEMLQEDVVSLQKTREELTEELTQLTSKIESLEKDNAQLGELKEKYKETQQRYNAVLQMYGEKEEETEELRLDLEDVKAMYKAQIQELIGGMR